MRRGRISPTYTGSGNGRGLLTYEGPRGTVEVETFRCQHCGTTNRVEPFCDPADAGGLCRMCGGLMCKGCADKGGCTPFEERLRLSEERGISLRSYGF